MRGLWLTIMLAATGCAVAATTVYTWVDAQGVTHYSDQPHPGAKKLHVSAAPTFSMPPVAAQPAAAPSTAPASRRLSCSIESPTDRQMLMNAWSVSGEIRLPPHLNPADEVLLMLDGKILRGAASLDGAFTLRHIDRGSHTLAAQIEGPDGRVICEAPTVTFFVHQPSAQAPNAVSRPAF